MQIQQGMAAAPLSFRNRLINGDFQVDQRKNGNTHVSPPATYTLDRWFVYCSAPGALEIDRVGAGSPWALKQSIRIRVTTADASLGATDYNTFEQRIENSSLVDFDWGLSGAKPVTVSFWVYATVTGQYGFAFMNYDGSRSWVGSYTVNVANTWEYKTITIPGDTGGVWVNPSGLAANGATICFVLGVGSDYVGVAGWQTGSFKVGLAGNTNFVGATGRDIFFTDVQLEVGSQATAFERVPYDVQLARCQRYYYYIGGESGNFPVPRFYAPVANAFQQFPISHPTTMRAGPSSIKWGTWTAVNAAQPAIVNPGSGGFGIQFNAVAAGDAYTYPDSVDDKMTFDAEL